jgi:signal peptidase I
MSKNGKEILVFLLVIFSIYFGLSYLTTKVFFLCRVQQTSMETTLLQNQVLLGKKQQFTIDTLQRGDIVVFLSNSGKEKSFLIKRAIGLPGEHLTIRAGKVYINNSPKPLEEKYRIYEVSDKKFNFENVDVPSDSVFLMGDNSPSSLDSRTFGPVKLDSILGKVFFRLYPIKKIGQI